MLVSIQDSYLPLQKKKLICITEAALIPDINYWDLVPII